MLDEKCLTNTLLATKPLPSTFDAEGCSLCHHDPRRSAPIILLSMKSAGYLLSLYSLGGVVSVPKAMRSVTSLSFIHHHTFYPAFAIKRS
ncbi:hypothetical protein TSMEX_010688 [Taenia solium]|eukprot:TsM_000407900 transcript=TsM_000407900 gene=TsM_000407900